MSKKRKRKKTEEDYDPALVCSEINLPGHVISTINEETYLEIVKKVEDERELNDSEKTVVKINVRKIKNRVSAKASRIRRRNKVDEMNREIKRLVADNAILHARLEKSGKQNEKIEGWPLAVKVLVEDFQDIRNDVFDLQRSLSHVKREMDQRIKYENVISRLISDERMEEALGNQTNLKSEMVRLDEKHADDMIVVKRVTTDRFGKTSERLERLLLGLHEFDGDLSDILSSSDLTPIHDIEPLFDVGAYDPIDRLVPVYHHVQQSTASLNHDTFS